MEENPEQAQSAVRPQFLTVLCVLSFIWSGMASASFLMMYVSYDEVMPLLEAMVEEFPLVEMFLYIGKNLFLTGFILYSISIFGVSMMWRMRKAGFHFYTGAQIGALLMPMFYISGYPIPYMDGLSTILFIALYGRFYSLFKA